jgi:serine/threonine-protein kinase
MESVAWTRIEQVLDLVLERDPSEWSAVLDETCGTDPELRRAVEDLLSRATEAREYLESPPALTAAALVAQAQSRHDDQAGRRIGAYRIVRQIGRGGMSRVFLAERADGQFEQRVALKLLRPGMDNEIDRERFRSERQILASLEHPHVARLLDGGVTEDGSPYLVLEYVDGQPIDAHCEARQLPPRARLELFLAVIDATQYAHRNLIVHRDLKPSNILVADDGAVKLLDFGLAKLLEPVRETEDALTTRTGHRWMTPEYAAPEQIRGEPVSTLTDVYQLGAVLYELVTGQPPFGKRGANVRALEDAVLSAEPAAPSSALASSERARLRGDVDAIVLKALRKEPDQRYTSAQALADDLRRHLTGHPVLARRQTAAYRARRFAHRHRVGIAAAGAIVIMAIAYGVTVTVQRARVQRALAQAKVGTEKAEQVTDFVLGLFEASEQGRVFRDTVSAQELLRRGTARARELTGQPEVRAEMLDAVGQIHYQLGDYEQAEKLFQEVLALRRQVLGEDHLDVATSLARLEPLAEQRGDMAAAIDLTRRALDIRRRHLGPEDPLTVESLFWYAQSLHEGGEEARAQAVFDEWAAAFAKQPPSLTPRRGYELLHLGQMLEFRRQYDAARPQYEEALRIFRTLYGDQHPSVGRTQYQIADLLIKQDKFIEAEHRLRSAIATIRAAYPAGHSDLTLALSSFGRVLRHLKKWEEAEAVTREVLDIARHSYGPDHPTVAIRMQDLGVLLTQRGSYAEADPYLRSALRIQRSRFGDHNVMTAYASVALGDERRLGGDLVEAESLLVRAFAVLRDRTSDIAAPARRKAIESLALLYEAEGRTAEAAKYHALEQHK